MNAKAKNHETELKELEVELKREELRQLKSGFKLQWLTPASIAVMLPVIGGLLLYVANELKEYSDAYQALAKVDVLQERIASLEKQKDSLNLEIPALLGLKSHYADEAEKLQKSANKLENIVAERQQRIDQLYLRGKYAAQEGIYALDHARRTDNLDRKTSNDLEQQIRQRMPESARTATTLIQNYQFYQDMSGVTNKVLEEFLALLKEISPSEEALKLQWHPEGAFLSGRPIMATIDDNQPRYYDTNLGRYLNAEEVGQIR